MQRRIAFARVSADALLYADEILARWLPGGRRQGAEWIARNPRRSDSHLGSFKVNLRTGKWSDFATGDGGRDLVSLAAYLHGLDQPDAARRVADMLGVSAYE